MRKRLAFTGTMWSLRGRKATPKAKRTQIRKRHNPAWVAAWMRLGGGDGSLESLVETLRRGPSDEFSYAVAALIALHATEVVPAVSELMSTGEEALQYAAARLLSDLAEGDQVELLISAAGPAAVLQFFIIYYPLRGIPWTGIGSVAP